jgi:hypothetical protein
MIISSFGPGAVLLDNGLCVNDVEKLPLKFICSEISSH